MSADGVSLSTPFVIPTLLSRSPPPAVTAVSSTGSTAVFVSSPAAEKHSERKGELGRVAQNILHHAHQRIRTAEEEEGGEDAFHLFGYVSPTPLEIVATVTFRDLLRRRAFSSWRVALQQRRQRREAMERTAVAHYERQQRRLFWRAWDWRWRHRRHMRHLQQRVRRFNSTRPLRVVLEGWRQFVRRRRRQRWGVEMLRTSIEESTREYAWGCWWRWTTRRRLAGALQQSTSVHHLHCRWTDWECWRRRRQAEAVWMQALQLYAPDGLLVVSMDCSRRIPQPRVVGVVLLHLWDRWWRRYQQRRLTRLIRQQRCVETLLERSQIVWRRQRVWTLWMRRCLASRLAQRQAMAQRQYHWELWLQWARRERHCAELVERNRRAVLQRCWGRWEQRANASRRDREDRESGLRFMVRVSQPLRCKECLEHWKGRWSRRFRRRCLTRAAELGRQHLLRRLAFRRLVEHYLSVNAPEPTESHAAIDEKRGVPHDTGATPVLPPHDVLRHRLRQLTTPVPLPPRSSAVRLPRKDDSTVRPTEEPETQRSPSIPTPTEPLDLESTCERDASRFPKHFAGDPPERRSRRACSSVGLQTEFSDTAVPAAAQTDNITYWIPDILPSPTAAVPLYAPLQEPTVTPSTPYVLYTSTVPPPPESLSMGTCWSPHFFSPTPTPVGPVAAASPVWYPPNIQFCCGATPHQQDEAVSGSVYYPSGAASPPNAVGPFTVHVPPPASVPPLPEVVPTDSAPPLSTGPSNWYAAAPTPRGFEPGRTASRSSSHRPSATEGVHRSVAADWSSVMGPNWLTANSRELKARGRPLLAEYAALRRFSAAEAAELAALEEELHLLKEGQMGIPPGIEEKIQWLRLRRVQQTKLKAQIHQLVAVLEERHGVPLFSATPSETSVTRD